MYYQNTLSASKTHSKCALISCLFQSNVSNNNKKYDIFHGGVKHWVETQFTFWRIIRPAKSQSQLPIYSRVRAVTSECVESSLHAAAQEEELSSHSDQVAAWGSIFIPKQTLQCGVLNFCNGQHLHHPPTLYVCVCHTHTHTHNTRQYLNIIVS